MKMKINEWYYRIYLYNQKVKLETSLQVVRRHLASIEISNERKWKLANAEVAIIDKLEDIYDIRGSTFYFFGICHIFPERIKQLYSQFLDSYKE